MLGAGAATAQSQVQTTDELKFEAISVDGNNLVVRDQNGTRAVTVPKNFKFTVDGKSMSVHDLKPGMKGTATVTTTMLSRLVYVTQKSKRVRSCARSGSPRRRAYRRRCSLVQEGRYRRAWCADFHGRQARSCDRPQGRRPDRRPPW